MTLTHDELTALDQVPAGSVVVGLDGSPDSLLAVDWAAAQAGAEGRTLVLAHAMGDVPLHWSDRADTDPATARDDLVGRATTVLDGASQRAARRLAALSGIGVVRMMRLTPPDQLLVELSERAAYVVLGSRGRGPLRSLLQGSIGVSVVRQAACPVVVHRPAHPGLVRRGVVVLTDGSPADPDVLELGYRVAAFRDLPVRVLHGRRGRSLADFASTAHLLVVGAERAIPVLEHARCPVAVVPRSR